MLAEQTIVPDFAVRDDQNRLVKLADYRGQWVVLYFFSKAMTSG